MRWTTWVALAAGTGAVLACAGGALAQPSPPLERKPGWWEMDVRTEVGGKPVRQVMHMCTDAAVDRVQTPFGVHMGKGCPPVTPVRAGAGWDVAASCKVAAMTVSVKGRLTGDLASAYHVDLVTRMDPPPTPQTASIPITLDARRLGACPAGKKPGDVDLDMHMNVAPQRAPTSR